MTAAPRIILHNDNTEILERMLAKAVPEAVVKTCQNYSGLPDLIERFDPDVVYSIRFAGTPEFPSRALFGQKGPRWLAIGGAGTDHLGQWDPKVTTVTNAAGVAADMMAEYVFGGLLQFTLDLPGLQADKSARVWKARQMVPLKEKTLLIIGLGHTGRAIAHRAQAFGMTVLGTRARPQQMDNVDEVYAAEELMALLPRADFIAVCCPLLPSTKGIIGAGQIAAMRPGVVIADVSRGGVIDQTELVVGLRNGPIKSAVLDVFETEPLPADHPLWSMENVIISPHCSSVYDGWEEASFSLFLENLNRWTGGVALRNVVNPALGY